MPDFLLEIGLEEIPARMIAGAEAELLRRTLAMLGKEALLSEKFDPLTDAKSYSTPRRLAVLVRNVQSQQKDVTEEVTGPATKIAFKDGVPTPAAEAFARKSGVSVSELRKIDTPKGEYLAATSVKKGRSASEVIASEMPKELAAIYWAKSMYWRAGKPERFVRPVRWMVCLLGDSIVPVAFGGKTAGRASFGHRVLSNGEAFEIQTPASYLALLEGEFVLADVEARRHRIRKALDKVTREVPGARWREDEALVDTVTHLTEWPDVLLGNFEAAYLELPEEVLVTVMRDHQKYFAIEDAAGKLAPHFLTVVNIALDEKNAAIIKQGNERVLRARFNDARFFWEFDQRTPLTERVKLLENVTFQKDLGSYAKKSERVALLTKVFASPFTSLDTGALEQAVLIAKTDLTTELVKEFTDLQGIVGGLYAEAQGLGETVKAIVYDQYLPKNMDDSIPRNVEGCIYGISDRMDTLCNMFEIGLEPTGSKDPFGLRRAANGVIKILSEANLHISYDFLLTMSCAMSTITFDKQEKLKEFMAERLAYYLREVCGNAYDTVKAVLSADRPVVLYDPKDVLSAATQMAEAEWSVPDIVARARAITEFRHEEDFLSVCASFRRMKNILEQSKSENDVIAKEVRTGHFRDGAENKLESQAGLVRDEVDQLRRSRDYVSALRAIATLRPYLDSFFDAVMVRDPEIDIRANRLALLNRLIGDFRGIADFSEIVVS